MSKLDQFSKWMKKRSTPAEKRFKKYLASCCNSLGLSFETQRIFWNYREAIGYIADFYISRARVIFEIDGGYHNTNKQQIKDKLRDEYLATLAIKTIRIDNQDTENESFCKRLIYEALENRKYYTKAKNILPIARKLIKKAVKVIEDGVEVTYLPPADEQFMARLYKTKPKTKHKPKKCKLETPGSITGSVYWMR